MIILTHEINELVKDNHAFIVLVRSIALRASYSGQSSFPSLNTICKDTNLSKPTIIKALNYLESINLLKITRQKQGQLNLVNHYSITTEFIKTIGNLKVEGVVNDVYHSNESINKTDMGGSKGDLPGVVNDVYTNHKSNLTSSNINKEISEIENFRLDEMRKSLWLKQGYTEDGITRHTLNWIDYIKGLEKLPLNLSSSLDNYLSNQLPQFLKEQKSLENVSKADDLAKQRIEEYHEVKTEKIKEVARSKPKSAPTSYTKSTGKPFQPKPVFKPYYRDYDSREAYYADIEAHRQDGYIVEPDELPVNAATYWGETENNIVQTLGFKMRTVDEAISNPINENARKNELLRQLEQSTL